jgi:hypothetical protein
VIDLRGPFPANALRGADDALILFAAAFLGCQDAAWAAQAHLQGTCVDTDTFKLEEMRPEYPEGWEFVTADVFEFVKTTGRTWDVVTADPWTNMMGLVADIVGRLCQLARRAVIVGSGRPRLTAPDGWAVTGRLRRSFLDGGVYWTTLEPA